MSMLYDWYETPKPSDRQDEPVTLYPRVRMNGTTTTAQLQRQIEEACSLTEGDVAAVLSALSHYVGKALAEGRQVQLDGIGRLSPVLGCTEPVTPETRQKSSKVRLKSIRFTPDKKLRGSMGALRVEPLNLSQPTRVRLTDEQIEQRIRTYLQEHDFLTRATLQSLCHLSRTTAVRHLNRLCASGFLHNKGLRHQPVYCLGE